MTLSLQRALEARGYKKVDLDDFDVWGYGLSLRA